MLQRTDGYFRALKWIRPHGGRKIILVKSELARCVLIQKHGGRFIEECLKTLCVMLKTRRMQSASWDITSERCMEVNGLCILGLKKRFLRLRGTCETLCRRLRSQLSGEPMRESATRMSLTVYWTPPRWLSV